MYICCGLPHDGHMVKHMNISTARITVGGLAAGAAVTTGTKIDASRLQGTRIHKMKYHFSFIGKTADEGPLVLGFHRANISATEIAEFYAADPQSSLDVPGIDQANFDVYPAVLIARQQTATAPIPDHMDGWRTLNWPWKNLPEDDAMNIHVCNISAGTVATGIFVDATVLFVEEFDVQ